jgi:acyl-CoA reductase-like NAD-dependent aldehyde dehydrogenase
MASNVETLGFPTISTYKWSCKDTSKRFTVENPATGEVITTIQAGDAETTVKAIEAAQKAFDTDWRWRSPAERGAILLKAADVLNEHKEEFARILCMENGKPYQDALMFDCTFLVKSFQYFGSLVDKLPSEFYDQGSVYATVVYEPFGVCAGILPFNWPPVHTGGKLAPSLAAGNTMILKPGEQAPLTVLRICEVLETVLPKDVVQVVPGIGIEVPQVLTTHPLIKMVSMTGSTPAGAATAKSASDTIKPVVLELGGKNASVVFEDADFDRAVRDAVEGAFFNKGEACTASSRLLVQCSIYDHFVKNLAAGVHKLIVGNGMDPKTHVGPCVSKKQQERVLNYIEIGKDAGAEIAAQGNLPSDPACKNGFFVPPTVFKNVTRDMRIVQEEMFGPVVTVTPFDTEEEAISITNESKYGLVAYVYTRDHERALRISRKIDAGVVFLNNNYRLFLGTPFGGAKESGHGREHCIETLREWSRAKTIRQPSGMSKIPSWRALDDIFGESGCEPKGSRNGI